MVKLPQIESDGIEREACEESFYEFFLSFWSVINEEVLEDNWHIQYLCDELQELSINIVARNKKLYDLVINIPPGTTKSTITTIMFPVWLWTQDASLRIITNSYSADLSIEHSVKSRDIIMSDKFRRLFPEIILRPDKYAKSSYENTSKGARYTTSTGGTITGKHAHVLINDDPENPKQALSDKKRKEANEHTKTLSSRKVNKKNTPTITIMQRLHSEDVTGYLLKKKKDRIKHICLPATLSKYVKPEALKEYYVNGLLDPQRLPEEVIDEAKEDLGSRSYAGQYDQTPSEEGGNIIHEDWFGYCSFAQFMSRKGLTPIIFFGDTAYTEKQINDPSGFIATCKLENTLYIINAITVRKKFPDLVRFLPVWVGQNMYTNGSSIRIEPKASGKSVIQTLAELTGLNIVETPNPEGDKEVRLNAASPIVESGRVVLIEGKWNGDFVEEICGFPSKPHDEYVDLIGYAINYHFKEKHDYSKTREKLLAALN